MSRGVAVIGGGWGDEGKGLVVDYWASKLDDPVVIRFNGSCQAGHTAVTAGGNRHVFSHFGAGTFAGAETYLSRFFVVNPLLFMKEHKEFVSRFGFAPKVYVSPDCVTTTPVEMIINQSLETMRSHNRHGSCGVGFGETLERMKRTGLLFHIKYMLGLTPDQIAVELHELTKYAHSRVDFEHAHLNDYRDALLANEKLAADFYDALVYFAQHTMVIEPDLFERDIVFEGAQGLELDQDYGVFPFVTRSNTGMRNVTKLIERYKSFDFKELLVNYVTRTYQTRHGAGPLPGEQHAPFPFKDDTNVTGEWQGALRWGWYDHFRYRSITDKDFALYANPYNDYFDVNRVDTVTHVDQLSEERQNSFLIHMSNEFDYFSYGRTRNDVRVRDE